MNIDQYKAVIELLPQVEYSLRAKGIEVPRPQYDDGASATSTNEKDNGAAKVKKDDAEDEEEDEEPVKPSKSASKLEKFKLKQNHEATSDEDDG